MGLDYDTQQPRMQNKWVHASLCHAAGVASLALHPLDARSRMQVAGEGAADWSNRESCGNVNTHTHSSVRHVWCRESMLVYVMELKMWCTHNYAINKRRVWDGYTNTRQTVAM